MSFIFNYLTCADFTLPFFAWKNRSAMSATLNRKFVVTYIELYQILSCPYVSKNVYVAAHVKILLKFAIEIKFFRCGNFSLPKL